MVNKTVGMQAIVISDNLENADLFAHILRKEGMAVAMSKQIQRIVPTLVERPVELILYSTTIRGELGEIVSDIRKVSAAVIVIVVNTMTEDEHCDLLDAGADWVLTRPLSTRLLTRYLRRLLRHTSHVPMAVLPEIASSEVILNAAARTVQLPGREPKRLTQLEFRLLYVLMATPGYVFTTDELVERVWGYEGEGNRGLVRGLVRRLRRKIEPNSDEPQYILNVPSHGYQFVYHS